MLSSSNLSIIPVVLSSVTLSVRTSSISSVISTVGLSIKTSKASTEVIHRNCSIGDSIEKMKCGAKHVFATIKSNQEVPTCIKRSHICKMHGCKENLSSKSLTTDWCSSSMFKHVSSKSCVKSVRVKRIAFWDISKKADKIYGIWRETKMSNITLVARGSKHCISVHEDERMRGLLVKVEFDCKGEEIRDCFLVKFQGNNTYPLTVFALNPPSTHVTLSTLITPSNATKAVIVEPPIIMIAETPHQMRTHKKSMKYMIGGVLGFVVFVLVAILAASVVQFCYKKRANPFIRVPLDNCPPSPSSYEERRSPFQGASVRDGIPLVYHMSDGTYEVEPPARPPDDEPFEPNVYSAVFHDRKKQMFLDKPPGHVLSIVDDYESEGVSSVEQTSAVDLREGGSGMENETDEEAEDVVFDKGIKTSGDSVEDLLQFTEEDDSGGNIYDDNDDELLHGQPLSGKEAEMNEGNHLEVAKEDDTCTYNCDDADDNDVTDIVVIGGASQNPASYVHDGPVADESQLDKRNVEQVPEVFIPSVCSSASPLNDDTPEELLIKF